MKELIYKFLYDSAAAETPLEVLTDVGVALLLSFVVYATYKVTFSGVVYSKKFNISLIMLTIITTVVMNIIGSSVALSLGMVGALSIVRFRTAIKDPRDTAYIFWTIAIGLGTGSGHYYIVLIGSLCIAIICIIMSYGMKNDDSYLVIVRGSEECTEAVRAVLFQSYRACKLRAETVTETYTEIVYQVKLKKPDQIREYEAIRKIDGVTYVNLVAQNGETLG